MRANKTTCQDAAKSVIRILLIVSVATVGTIGLMAIPLDDDPCWFATLILSKVIAVAGWYVAWLLYAKWSKVDKWLEAYDKSCEEALNAPNPLYIDEEDEQR